MLLVPHPSPAWVFNHDVGSTHQDQLVPSRNCSETGRLIPRHSTAQVETVQWRATTHQDQLSPSRNCSETGRKIPRHSTAQAETVQRLPPHTKTNSTEVETVQRRAATHQDQLSPSRNCSETGPTHQDQLSPSRNAASQTTVLYMKSLNKTVFKFRCFVCILWPKTTL